jgi:hypothetical protein
MGMSNPYYTDVMRARLALLILAVIVASGVGNAQTRRPAVRPAPPAPPIKEAPQVGCPAPLGVGVSTKLVYCDVLTGRDPAAGIVITIPPHRGAVTLTFDLHNRHTYSEEQMKDKRGAYARYTASVGALTMDNTLISRAAVQSEFRGTTDLVERIDGGAGPSGLKAVAPTGQETITLTIPEAENQVSILGEKLVVDRADGSATYTSPGRPIAIVSNVMLEYRPPPPVRAPAARTPVRPAPRTPASKPPVKR